MCRSCDDGGRRCPSSVGAAAAARQFAGRTAVRIHGVSTPAARAAVAALPHAFRSNVAKVRESFVGSTRNQAVLDLALADPSERVRDRALGSPHTDPSSLEQIDVTALRRTSQSLIAENASATPVTLSRLIEAGPPSVRRLALRNLIYRGESIDEHVSSEHVDVRVTVAEHTDDTATRDALLADAEVDVRVKAAGNTSAGPLPPHIILKDDSARVRATAARATRDPRLMSRLAEDPDLGVAMAVRDNPLCPAQFKTTAGLTGDISGYASLVEVALDHGASRMQVATAYAGPDADADADDEVKVRLALHPQASPPMQVREVANMTTEQRAFLADRPWASPQVLERLAHIRGRETRLLVALNPDAPRSALEHLAGVRDGVVSEAAQRTLDTLGG